MYLYGFQSQNPFRFDCQFVNVITFFLLNLLKLTCKSNNRKWRWEWNPYKYKYKSTNNKFIVYFYIRRGTLLWSGYSVSEVKPEPLDRRIFTNQLSTRCVVDIFNSWLNVYRSVSSSRRTGLTSLILKIDDVKQSRI